MGTPRIPLHVFIGTHTFEDGLTPSKEYAVSRAWRPQDKVDAGKRRAAIFETFPWLDPDTELIYQNPAIRVKLVVDTDPTSIAYVEKYMWHPSERGPVLRMWDSDPSASHLEFYVMFTRPVPPEELERRERNAAMDLFAKYTSLTARARGIFDDSVHQYHTRTNTPVYAIGRGIVGTEGLRDANCIVMRGNTGRLFVADAETLAPVCVHTYDDSLPSVQVTTGHACPLCSDAAEMSDTCGV